MSEKAPVHVHIAERKGKGLWDRLRDKLKGPQTTIQESKRFSKLGYLDYPKTRDLHLRIFTLMDILEEIETELADIDGKDQKTIQAGAFKNIRRLFRAFMTVGGPWLRGLDNRELAKKTVAFFELETLIGHLPAFYPDLKFCTQVLINLSWQAIDVTAQTPVLFETKAMIQGQGGRVDLTSEIKDY